MATLTDLPTGGVRVDPVAWRRVGWEPDPAQMVAKVLRWLHSGTHVSIVRNTLTGGTTPPMPVAGGE